MIGLALALAAATAPLHADAVDGGPARVVFVIGSDGGDGAGPDGASRPRLSYADDDAARAYLTILPEADRAYLLTTFDGDSARLFPELTTLARPPTKEELSHVLGEAFWRLRALKDSGRNTELVFSFAGHGDVSVSGEGFLVLQDGALTRSELSAQVVRASPADVNHVLLDACASYFMVSSRGTEATAPAVALTPQLLDLLRKDDDAAWDRTGVLVSTSDSAAVHESGALGAGVFSFLLRSALLGAGDVDGDGRVEYAEAAAFIAAASADVDDPRARLRVHARAPARRPHAALADLNRGSDRRFLAIDVKGVERLRLLDEHGLPVAEIHRAAAGAGDAPVVLALAGSAFYVVQVGDKEATLVPRSAGAYALSSLHFSDSAQRRGADVSAFARLFTTPWGRSFFDGWATTSTLARPLTGQAFAAGTSVAWAEDAAPSFRPPWMGLAVGSFVVSGVAAVVSAGAAGMNLASFATLQESYAQSATIDPEQALTVEAWRTTATVAGAVAVGSALAGVGLFVLAGDEEEAP